MNEKEQYYTAKLYMDKLANGINPLDGQAVPEDSLLNDVCMCRMFNFLANVLDQIIRNDCKITIPNSKKVPFRITEEQRSNIQISETPVKLTAISHRIQRVLENNVKGINSILMAQWLESQGYLSTIVENSRAHRVATEEGEMLGISTIKEIKGENVYKSNYYNNNAQAFIIANLEKIASYRK
ncbi:MAG: hypothetical protein GX241_01810 [Ruminococcaceae bacterium]|nr:hypothetical protein [Oscillospiraceae bacterium]